MLECPQIENPPK